MHGKVPSGAGVDSTSRTPRLTNELVDPRFERVGDIPYGGNIDQFDEGGYSREGGGFQNKVVRRAERRQRKTQGGDWQIVQLGNRLYLPAKAEVG